MMVLFIKLNFYNTFVRNVKYVLFWILVYEIEMLFRTK